MLSKILLPNANECHTEAQNGLSSNKCLSDITAALRLYYSMTIPFINPFLDYSFGWCRNLDTSESSSDLHGKFCSLVLEKDGKTSLTDRVRNEEVVQRVKEERNKL
jgi:hypothetical protein